MSFLQMGGPMHIKKLYDTRMYDFIDLVRNGKTIADAKKLLKLRDKTWIKWWKVAAFRNQIQFAIQSAIYLDAATELEKQWRTDAPKLQSPEATPTQNVDAHSSTERHQW